jgi:hypothetical protein
MSDLRDLGSKAEQYAKDHPDQADKGVQSAEKGADKLTGDKFDQQIQEGGQRVEKGLGGDGGDANQQQGGQQPQGDQQPPQGGQQ